MPEFINPYTITPLECDAYFQFCDELLSKWAANTISLSPRVQRKLDTQAVPEPYLIFGQPLGPDVAFLTLNPGGVIENPPIQARQAIEASDSPVQMDRRWWQNASAIANWYDRELPGAAGVRIRGMKTLARMFGASGFIQFEAFPFHSGTVAPNDLVVLAKEPLLCEYGQLLRRALEPCSTVIAIGGRSPEKARLFLSLLGDRPYALINLNAAGTFSMYYHTDHRGARALTLNPASNNLPAEERFSTIRQLLGR